jgi:hypothetical protein
MVLTELSRHQEPARHRLRQEVLGTTGSPAPSNVTIEGVTFDKNSLQSLLKQHLTSAAIALKHYTQEFLYLLCNQDGNSTYCSFELTVSTLHVF